MDWLVIRPPIMGGYQQPINKLSRPHTRSMPPLRLRRPRAPCLVPDVCLLLTKRPCVFECVFALRHTRVDLVVRCCTFVNRLVEAYRDAFGALGGAEPTIRGYNQFHLYNAAGTLGVLDLQEQCEKFIATHMVRFPCFPCFSCLSIA